MIIKVIRVQNYRPVRDEILRCDALTALVGRNGTGKSALLRAIELFYAVSPRIDRDDFYNRDPSIPIVISVTFDMISDGAKKLFSNYVEDDSLTVERVIHWNDGKPMAKLHGSRLQAKEFNPGRRTRPLATS